MKYPVAGLAILGALIACPPPAAAQFDSRDAIALQNQILDLRHQVEILRDQVSRGGGGSAVYRGAPPSGGGDSDLTAQLLDRVNRQDDQIRELRGRLDESDNARQRQFADLSKQLGDLNFKLGNGGGGGLGGVPAGAAPLALGGPPPRLSPPPSQLGGPPPQQDTPLVPPAPVRRTPELVLQEGNAALARHDYTTAEAAARELLAGPRTPRSTDAQFLLAQSLEGQRNYSAAAVAYDDAYNRSPSGFRGNDALLGLANSLIAINEKPAACATLAKLRAANPRPTFGPAIASAASRAGCR